MPRRKPSKKIKQRRNQKRLLALTAFLSALVLYILILIPNESSDAFPVHLAPKRANYYVNWDIPASKVVELAKWDLLVLDMETQIFSSDSLKKIRQLNPNIILLAYITPQEIRKDALTGPGPMRRKLASGISDKWYLTDSSGTRITFWPGTWMLNIADNAPDINGIKFNNYLANFVSREILGTGLWDGVFYDNAWENLIWLTGSNVDLDKDGVNNDGIDAHWQSGFRNLYNQTRALTGARYIVVGNGVNEVYKNDLNGVMLESFPSLLWKDSMRIYAANQNGSPEPRVNIINSNTANKGDSNNYRKMRFGLASTLLLDGYYGFDYGDQNHGQTWWYDEYNVNLGSARGEAVSMNNTPKFKEDVWKREYDHGIAIANPTLQAQEIELNGEYEKITGKQDPNINDGSIVSQVTVGPKDGLIMLKTFQTVKNLVFSNGDFLRFYDMNGNRSRNGFFSFEDGLPGGAKIFTGDLDGDGKEEKITAVGPRLKIFNNRGEIWFDGFPLGANYKGELSVAVGKIKDNEVSVLVSGSSVGKVVLYTYYGAVIKNDFYPLGKKYKDGFSVAIGNLDGGQGEIIIGTTKKQPEIIIYDSGMSKIKKRFYAENKNFKGNTSLAVGDINGDGVSEIVVALNSTSGSIIKTFNFTGKIISQFRALSAFGSTDLKPGVLDVNFDGIDEIVLMNGE